MCCLGVCRDDPEVTAPDRVRYDACLLVGETSAPEGEVGVQRIGGGEYALITLRETEEAHA